MHGRLKNRTMSSSELMITFHQKVNSCESFASLNFLCLRFASQFGVRAMAYHHLPHFGAEDAIGLNVICVGFPQELVNRFEEGNLIKIDPTIQQVMYGTRAQWWEETERPRRLSRKEREYLEFAASKVSGGIHLPVFGPNGRNGYVSMGFDDHSPDLDDSDLSLLQSCCQFAHQQYCHLLLVELPRASRLSPREKEILSWAAKGKSNGVIAEILDITESTVITYLERAFRKLGVDNRVTATLRASSLGELSYLS